MPKLYRPIDNDGHERLLIEFGMIIDIDFGIIKTINKYYHSEFFCLNLLEVDNEDIWLGLIHDNITTNPVDCVIRSEVEKWSDYIYSTLMEEELLIYSLSRKTNLYNLVLASLGINSFIEVTILCKNSIQEEIVQNLFPNHGEGLNTIIYDKNKANYDFSVAEYSSLFIRHISSLLDYDDVIGKSIFLYECLTNMDVAYYNKGKGFIPNKLYALFIEVNDIRIVSLYQYNNSYFINNNYLYGDDSNIESNKLDEYLVKGEGSEEDDEEAIIYENYLRENSIPINASEDEVTMYNMYLRSEVENGITPESINPFDYDNIESLLKDSIPIMEESPDLSKLEEEEDYE